MHILGSRVFEVRRLRRGWSSYVFVHLHSAHSIITFFGVVVGWLGGLVGEDPCMFMSAQVP